MLVHVSVQEVVHRHIVQRVSFIARDVSDARAFGYVYGCRDGRHQFYGIKTEKVVSHSVAVFTKLIAVVHFGKKVECFKFWDRMIKDPRS